MQYWWGIGMRWQGWCVVLGCDEEVGRGDPLVRSLNIQLFTFCCSLSGWWGWFPWIYAVLAIGAGITCRFQKKKKNKEAHQLMPVSISDTSHLFICSVTLVKFLPITLEPRSVLEKWGLCIPISGRWKLRWKWTEPNYPETNCLCVPCVRPMCHHWSNAS